ncbi:MAG: hypothetical protein RMY29_002275 [Nostoc sp. CreGUA01]|nr:hypothetical protein [Nostoc sp. CreGUA01]
MTEELLFSSTPSPLFPHSPLPTTEVCRSESLLPERTRIRKHLAGFF